MGRRRRRRGGRKLRAEDAHPANGRLGGYRLRMGVGSHDFERRAWLKHVPQRPQAFGDTFDQEF
jgi:hypothetical protein